MINPGSKRGEKNKGAPNSFYEIFPPFFFQIAPSLIISCRLLLLPTVAK